MPEQTPETASGPGCQDHIVLTACNYTPRDVALRDQALRELGYRSGLREFDPRAEELVLRKKKPACRKEPKKVHMKDLKFGVEIEFIDASMNDVSDQIQETLRNAGTPGWFPHGNWNVVFDGSLYDDCGECGEEYCGEVVTPPLQYGDIPLLQTVVRELRKIGASVNNTCGVHVHVESRHLDERGLARLFNLVKRHETLLYTALEVKGSRSKSFCRRLPARISNRIRDRKKEFYRPGKDPMPEIWYGSEEAARCESREHYHSTRYYGLNLHSHWFRGTVEFRFFNGTLHAGKIRSYVALALALTAKAIQGNGTGNGHELYNGDRKKSLEQLRRFITNIGITGDEFENCRLHLLNGLLLNKRDLQCAD